MILNAIVEEWISVIKKKYPGLEETQKVTVLHSEYGSICAYHSSKKFVVYGDLMTEFEKDFEKMSERILTEKMEAMKIKSEKGRPEEPEVEGTSSPPTNKTQN